MILKFSVRLIPSRAVFTVSIIILTLIPYSRYFKFLPLPKGIVVAPQERYGKDSFELSFELFPPKTAESEAMLWQTVDELMGFEPTLITCTYGAGGSTQTKTLEVLNGVHVRHPSVAIASHLTCVGSTTDQLREYLRKAEKTGVTAIVALRGDPPQGETAFTPVANGLHYAVELVNLIKQEFPQLRILVAGYPETHQEAVSTDADLQFLKQKCDAGSDTVVTQLFYDNADFFRFRERCLAIGITQSIIPGLMPVTNFKQIQRIANLCKARLPSYFTNALEKAGDDADAQFEVGVEYAAKQAEELISQGVPGMHLYVLNKSPATIRVLEQVGMTRP